MALSINITVHADEEGNFTAIESSILRAVALQSALNESQTAVFNGHSPEPTDTVTVQDTGKADPAPAEEAPKRKRRTKAEIEAAKAEAAAGEEDAPKASEAPAENEDTDPSAEEPSTDEGGTDEDEDFLGVETPKVPTIEEVVERVSVLMKKGKQEACKALLAEVTDGTVTRVSQMDAKFIPAFVAGLEKLEGK